MRPYNEFILITDMLMSMMMMMMMMIFRLRFALKGHVAPAGSPAAFSVPPS